MLGFTRNAQGKAVLAGAELGTLVDTAGTGTPAYVYDLDAIEQEARDMVAAVADQIGRASCRERV